MKVNRLKVSFYLKESKNKKSIKPTQIWVNVNTSPRTRKSASLSIEPANWDFKTGLPKKSYSNYGSLKSKLDKLESKIDNYCEACDGKEEAPTPEGIATAIRQKITVREFKEPTFFDRLSDYLEFKKGAVEYATFQKFNTLYNNLKDFEKVTNYKVGFGSINDVFEVRYIDYLVNTKGNFNDTIAKNFVNLKTFMRWAMRYGFHANLAFEHMGIQKNKSEPLAISLEELKVLLSLDLAGNPRLARIRDRFCFQCMTGQRVPDLNNLRWEDQIKDEFGKPVWHVYQIKGRNPEPVDVPLLGNALKILQRQDKRDNTGLIFSPISDVKYNKYIKELCQLAGFNDYIIRKKYRGKELVDLSGLKWQFISSHSARRTFVTISYELGMSPNAIMKITGHKNMATFLKYLGTSKGFVKEEHQKAWANAII
jgi:integrase